MQAVREHRGDAGEGVDQVRAGEQAEDVGADRIERHVAQVQQAGVADHDVQAEREQHVEQRDVDDANPGIAELLRHQRHDQQAHGGEQEDHAFVAFHVMLLLRPGPPHARRAGPKAAA